MNQKPATFYWKTLLFSLFIWLCLLLLFGVLYDRYLAKQLSQSRATRKVTPSFYSPTPASRLEELVFPGKELVANEKIDVYLSPGEKKVGFFVPGQTFIPTDKQEGDWMQVIDANQGYELWIRRDSPCRPVEQ